MSTLERFEAKLNALRKWFQESRPPSYGISHGFYWAEPMTEAEIRRIENQFGVSLPPEYRAFLKRLGNGRTGPGNHFALAEEGLSAASKEPFPLAAPLLGTCSPEHSRLPEEAQREDYHRLLKEWEAIPLDRGVLRISDYGCGIFGVLILNGPYSGKVWMISGDTAYYGPFGGLEGFHDESAPTNWKPTAHPKDYSFFEWYEHWLDGELKSAGLS